MTVLATMLLGFMVGIGLLVVCPHLGHPFLTFPLMTGAALYVAYKLAWRPSNRGTNAGVPSPWIRRRS